MLPVALHIPTLLIAVIVTYGVCSFAIGFLRWKHPSIPGLWHLMIGTATMVPAMLVYLIDVGTTGLFSGVVANLLSVLSLALILDGVSRFYGPSRRSSWPFVFLLLPFLYYWTATSPNTELRVVTILLPMMSICLRIAWVAYRRSAEDERLFSSLISFGFGAFGLGFLARLLNMTWNPWARIMEAGAPSTSMTFLLAGVAMISGTLGVVLVANQRWVRELIRAREAAEAGSRAKSQFLAVMSHEIRTPMNGVLGAASLILDSPTTPKIRRYARTVQHSGRAMLKIVDEVLDFSKIEAGGLKLERIPFDLLTEVEATVGAFKDAAEVASLDLRLEIAEELKPQLEEHFVIGDPARIRQILSNLINNALKFTDSGGVTVRLGSHGDQEADDQLDIELKVEDTGPGVPYDLQPELFQPFKQADASTTRRFGGTGLGLAICRDLVDRMGGQIGYRRHEPEPGSIFWVRIPFPVSEATGPQEASSELHIKSMILEGAKVLVAEDNAINQFVITEMLEDLGHQVTVAGDGREAVEAVEQFDPDLVLMDCRMPQMDGFEATRQIRRLEGRAGLPIIAVTATAFERDLEKCLESGMNAVLTKPIESKDLIRALETWLPTRSNAGQLAVPATLGDTSLTAKRS